MGVEGDNCTFSCDPGHMLQGSVTSGTCENTGSWSRGLPSCVPLYCPYRNKRLRLYGVMRSSSCSRQCKTQCTASCVEGFTGDNVTYLCNVTSDPTRVNWVPIGGEHVICERGLLVLICYTWISEQYTYFMECLNLCHLHVTCMCKFVQMYIKFYVI